MTPLLRGVCEVSPRSPLTLHNDAQSVPTFSLLAASVGRHIQERPSTTWGMIYFRGGSESGETRAGVHRNLGWCARKAAEWSTFVRALWRLDLALNERSNLLLSADLIRGGTPAVERQSDDLHMTFIGWSGMLKLKPGVLSSFNCGLF